jgi:hypothetical protein
MSCSAPSREEVRMAQVMPRRRTREQGLSMKEMRERGQGPSFCIDLLLLLL